MVCKVWSAACRVIACAAGCRAASLTAPLPCPLPCPAPNFEQKLRAGLKAELGALYPLLLLKPLEGLGGPGGGGAAPAAVPPEAGPHAALMAAEGLLHVAGRPQVLVDLFVNYDCSLQVRR